MFVDHNSENILAQIPEELPVLPLRNMVAFPFTVMPIAVGVPRSIKLVREAMQNNRMIALVTSLDAEIDEPTSEQVHQVGSIGIIQRAVQGENETMQLVVHVLERVRFTEWVSGEPYLKAKFELAPDEEDIGTEAEALSRSLIG